MPLPDTGTWVGSPSQVICRNVSVHHTLLEAPPSKTDLGPKRVALRLLSAQSLGKDSVSQKSLGTERVMSRAREYRADGGVESESHTCQAREFRLHYAEGIKVFQSTQQKSVVKVVPKILRL